MNIRLLNTLLKRMDAGTEAIVVQEPFASDPEDCVLVFDRSGSMSCTDYPETRLLAAFDAGLEFVNAKRTAKLSDLISIILFDDEATIVCEDVSLNRAVAVLNNLKVKNPICGGTDINAGLVAAERHFLRALRNYRSRIVLLTDGQGGNPIHTAQRLHKSNVRVDVIGIAGTPEEVAEEEMRKLASTINGKNYYRYIRDRTELLQHFKTIATDLMRGN